MSILTCHGGNGRYIVCLSLYIVCVSLTHIISIDKHECSCRTNAMYWPEFSNDALKSLNVRALNRENVLSIFTYSFISQACSSAGQGTGEPFRNIPRL